MLERIVHWLIFLAIMMGVLGALIDLLRLGYVQDTCCWIGP